MEATASEMQGLVLRVERLERQNRLLKRAALALIALPTVLTVMGQARPTRTVEAQDFILRDAAGNKRAELTMGANAAGLLFFDAKEQQTTVLTDGFVVIADPEKTKTKPERGYVMLSMVNSEPNILLRDSDGFSASLGVTTTVTVANGQNQKSSAASLTLFGSGKDGKVLWSAP